MAFFDFVSRTSTMGLRGRPLRLTITAVATIGFSLFGYDQGLMSGIITGTKFNEEFPATGGSSHHAVVVQGAVVSCYELGCFFGAIFALFRGEHIGRLPMLLMGSLIIIIGTVISVTAFKDSWGLGHFVIGRVITGVGNGLNTATIPVWQSELSRAENRGRLVTLEGAVVAVGTFIAYWLDFGLTYVDSSIQWRLPVAVQIIFALILFVGAIGLPESPRWLIAHDRKEEAYYVLGAVKDLDPADDEIYAEATAISDAVKRFARSQVGMKDLLTGGKTQHFTRMVIGSSTQFFQQFTGCNAAIYYSTVLFEKMDLGRTMSLIMGGVFATVYALATIPSFFLIDRVGRRNLFLIGAAGQGISFIITMACLAHENKNTQKGAAVGIYLFIVFFAFTILPLPWVYPPEINPMRTRTSAASVSTCTNWLCNFAVVMFTPLFAAQSQWGLYLFFALVNFTFIPVIFFFYPETAGRSLEEIDIIFAKAHTDGRPPWRVAATMPYLSVQEVEDEGTALGLYDDDFEKDNVEFKEDINSSSSGPLASGVLEKPDPVEEPTDSSSRPAQV